MENFGLEEIFLGMIAVVVPAIVAFVVSQWTSLKKSALESSNPYDDQLIFLAEKIASRIVDAKLEDPSTPLAKSSS